MSDPAFEMRLHRLFSESPPCPDAPLFAASVESRLSRGWALRRVLIGAAGVVGGSVAVVQIAAAGMGPKLVQAGDLLEGARRAFVQTSGRLPGPLSDLGQLPFGGEAIWLVAGLAVLAGALLASRSLEEI
jgi:hypothetical protein